MIKYITLVTAFLFINTMLHAQNPKVFLLDGKELKTFKLQAKTQEHKKILVKNLQKQADKYLNMQPVSVMDKSLTPVSGNKHDYMSQAPYFWYDSSKPNGLPYIRRDGERNPEILKITDRKNIGDLEKAASTLALAYYLTGKEEYAAKASALLKHWFIDTATKMNPHLDYGQAVPGVNTGRGIGIIETIALTRIADAVNLLQGSAAWKEHDDKAIKQWYSDYLNWMITSKNGTDEMAAKNNHGTFYDMQVVDFALFTGNKKAALKRLEDSKRRMDVQIDSIGRMPLELERTTALGYTTFNLEAWFKLASLAEQVGVDLWNYKNKEGRGIQDALDWVLPFATGEKEWTYQQINPYKKDKMYYLLLTAGKKYKDNKYLEHARKLGYTEKEPFESIVLAD